MESRLNGLRFSRKENEQKECLIQYNLEKNLVKLRLRKWNNSNNSNCKNGLEEFVGETNQPISEKEKEEKEEEKEQYEKFVDVSDEKQEQKHEFLDLLKEILSTSLQYVEHVLTLARDREKNLLQWVFHLTWGIEILDALSEKILGIQNEDFFRDNEKNCYDIQGVIANLLDVFKRLDTPEMLIVWNKNCTEEELSLCVGNLFECKNILTENLEGNKSNKNSMESASRKEKEGCIDQYNLEKDHVAMTLEKWHRLNVSDFLHITAEVDPTEVLEELEWLFDDFIGYICWKTENDDLYESTRQHLVESMERIYQRVLKAEVGKDDSSELVDILNQVKNVFQDLQNLTHLSNTDDVNKSKKQINALLWETIQWKTRKSKTISKKRRRENITVVELDRGLFTDFLNDILLGSLDYIGHVDKLLTLAQNREKNSDEWIFELKCGIENLDKLSQTIINVQDELELFKDDINNYNDIQTIIFDMLRIFRHSNTLEILIDWNINPTEEELWICDGELNKCRIALEENFDRLLEGGDSN
ncbi:MAG: hypothetical protein Q8835_02370 [Sweet potato little leaf phytoplasma]|nr:hypothetical protein [Sweet potato little leaf phytoplasma]